MKSPIPYFRVAGALALASGLMIGCQDFLGSDKAADGSAPAADEAGVLRLSIKDDSACLGAWNAILDARSAGHADSASEAAFLGSCVIETHPGPGPKPPVPPPLRPDSGMRCKWIVAQIDSGRDSLTISYRKYCPEECHKLAGTDTAVFEKRCRIPGPPGLPHPHPHDTLPPPRPPHHDSTDTVPPPKPPVPPDSGVIHPPPHHDSTDTVPPPKPPKPPDSLPPPPHPHHDSTDTVPPPRPPKPPDSGSVTPHHIHCEALALKLTKLDPASQESIELATELKEECSDLEPK